MDQDWIDSLIGARLVDLDNTGFTVMRTSRNGPKEFRFDFDEDAGDCCGFNTIESTFLWDGEGDAPAIVKVEYLKDFSEDGNGCTITFFGESSEIGKVSTYSSSGSGWCYGACVTVKCRENNDQALLSYW